MPATKPTDASVEDFLNEATPAQRKADGLALLDIFREVTGEDGVMWGPSMVGYGSYRYTSPSNPRNSGDWLKTGFSPRKSALTIYGLKDRPEAEALLPELGTYTEGAGCIYAKRLDDLDTDVLLKLIAIAYARPDEG